MEKMENKMETGKMVIYRDCICATVNIRLTKEP